MIYFLAVIALFALILILTGVKVLNEWERGVVLRLGRLLGRERGPGLIWLVPFGIDKMRKVDTRLLTMQVPPQEIITKDNVSTRITAVANFRVVNSLPAITQVTDYLYTTSQLAQTTLRSVLGQHTLNELLQKRDQINDQLQQIIDAQTEPFGVKVGVVELKDVEIPTDMQRAMAKQAEADREREAKIINADGEFQAAQKLTDAADVMATNPITLQLRYLQTLLEIGAGNNTTTLFPIPIDILSAFQKHTPRTNGKPPLTPVPPPVPIGGDDGPHAAN
jgi:regulator of protease activity HflC (stomatin/prohibitin superfamily)